MWKHAFTIDGRFVVTPGDWELAAMITNVGTIGEVQDDHGVQFVVSDRGVKIAASHGNQGAACLTNPPQYSR